MGARSLDTQSPVTLPLVNHADTIAWPLAPTAVIEDAEQRPTVHVPVDFLTSAQSSARQELRVVPACSVHS